MTHLAEITSRAIMVLIDEYDPSMLEGILKILSV